MKKEILFATHNLHKKEEIQQILGADFWVKSLSDFHITNEIIEDGTSFQENAAIKAQFCWKKTNIPSIGDDSGLVVETLDGRPGIHSARYASDHNFEKNIEKVLSELENEANRNAYFITVLCYFDGKETRFFEGKIHGKILTENKGYRGFGYDPIFVPDGYKITFAEMKPEKKNTISHRKKAMDKLLNALSKEL